jgi:uncharacterized repeat protein (TIGR03837 family)
MTARWDIFCKVVDNLGDTGVCWRLARQLVHEHALDVTLWIDDAAALARLAPGIDPSRDRQCRSGVDVRRWNEPLPNVQPASVVIEAFGGGLPEDYVAAMARVTPAPGWFVLEYLSAEAWIDDSHARPSPHPRLPLERRFWFPGFTPGSGGLLRERGLFIVRNAFRRDRSGENDFWSALGIPVHRFGERRLSLFCYPNPALPALLDALADGDDPATCIVPEGIAAGALDAWTAGNIPHRGYPFERGRLAVHAIPFLSQNDYDRLLWACDVNFVRGEDSFVRAQWAARPFVWNIYPQAESAHERKLQAFIDRFAAGMDPVAAGSVSRLHRAWNGLSGTGSMGVAWTDFAATLPQLENHGAAWSERLAGQPDLATGLVRAASGRV